MSSVMIVETVRLPDRVVRLRVEATYWQALLDIGRIRNVTLVDVLRDALSNAGHRSPASCVRAYAVQAIMRTINAGCQRR